ncbi:MAG: hypothetical protein ABI193_24095 [Minicystis sp.]
MLLRSLVTFAAVGVLALPIAGCSALTHSDEITISAESFGPAAAPAAAPQPLQLPPMPAAAKTGG